MVKLVWKVFLATQVRSRFADPAEQQLFQESSASAQHITPGG